MRKKKAAKVTAAVEAKRDEETLVMFRCPHTATGIWFRRDIKPTVIADSGETRTMTFPDGSRHSIVNDAKEIFEAFGLTVQE